MRSLALCALLLAGCIGIPIHAKVGQRAFPPQLEALPYEWVDVPASDGVVLRGIRVAQDGPPVLLLYGSGQAISGVWEMIVMLHDAGYQVLCCDYRGTGYSSGRWGTSRTLDDDARALWEWLRENSEGDAGVVGISIGAIAASALLDHEDPPAAVILDRPVDPKNVIRNFMRAEVGPVSAAISRVVVRAKCDIDIRANLAAAQASTLVVFPEHDLFLPPPDARELIAQAAPVVAQATVPGAHYSSHLVEPVLWRSTILDFLDVHLRPGRPARGGRQVPRGPTEVADWRLEGRTLHVTLGDDPGEVTLLLMGRRANGVVRTATGGREVAIELSRKHLRRLGPLFKPRVLPADFIKPIRTRWLSGQPPR